MSSSMSSSMYTISPASLHDLSDPSHPSHPSRHTQPSRRVDSQLKHLHNGPVTPESNLLSPYSLHAHSNSASPTLNSTTPADTISTVEQYQSADIFASGEYADDPFLGANFDDVPEDWLFAVAVPEDVGQLTTYPLSPDPTPSIPAQQIFQPSEQSTAGVQEPRINTSSRALHEPSINSVDSSQSDSQLTPDSYRGSWSSNESPAQAELAMAMATKSPRVMVSMWGKEDDDPVQGVERSFATGAESPRTVRPSHSVAGDLAYEQPYEHAGHVNRDTDGSWMPHESSGHRGLPPGNRSSEEVPSLNQQAAQREREEKNRDVDAWIARSAGNMGEDPSTGPQGSGPMPAKPQEDGHDNIPTREIPLGHTTENRHVDGQTYLAVDGPGGPITETDFDLMRLLRTWGDAPLIHAIHSEGKRYQPESSQAAIERFQRQCQDNASIISKAATWGTRRRSLPSVADIEEITSGNFLKKLSLSGNARRPSILQRVTSITRKTNISGYRKRKGSAASELPPEEFGDPVDRQESKDSLVPPARTSSWGLSKKPTPSLNTALVGMAASAAAIGTQHARSGSISATPITSPKSPFGSLVVPGKALRRARSKTELPMASSAEYSHPNLVGMLRRQGGPPVAQLARSQRQQDPEEDDDDDDDGTDEMDLNIEQGKTRRIEPTPSGFKAHILDLNPRLASTNGVDNPNAYLVERIAYQLNSRYKQLLTAKQNHMIQASQQACPSGTFCHSLGGTIRYLDSRGGGRGVDPLSAKPLSSDEDAMPHEGGINTESFPRGINPPPATSLPAEFECPICFTIKKFQKPSDWTKHVHEDVQPFTCTWDRCRDPKMFKRKADWVRHENEGHRHLEWWTCDVDDCRHVCYRRDNFLQHLVREHKFLEPKIKTKAAIKKAGGVDYTWQKVEQCHKETTKKPVEEPCRFCGKTFPTWKKLTVHLAKHMEHISLPIIDSVGEKELDPDTVISPVQDPPPRHFGIPPPPTTPSIKPDPQDLSPQIPQARPNMMDYRTASSTMGFSPIPQAALRNTYYTQQQQQQQMVQPYHDMPPQADGMMMPPHYNPQQQQYQGLPVTTTTFGQSSNIYALGMTVPDTEPFPAFDPLGIQDPPTYQTLGDNSLHGIEQYGSTHGSVSPYSHSPHPPSHNGQFYNS
ncbi:hypothetical protein F5Y14DRAFT_395988 [Nemania sp. NC0429]|nr:hypothetical protein F5Y14DRAFT_395988 [Nemania sp. NC0429]